MPKRRDEGAPYWVQLRQAERSVIEFALEHGKTIRGTAAILGISPNFLSERVRELGITPPEVRPGPKPGSKPNRPAAPQLRVVGDTPEEVPETPEDEEEVPGDPVTLDEYDEDEDELDGDDEEDEDDADDEEDEVPTPDQNDNGQGTTEVGN